MSTAGIPTSTVSPISSALSQIDQIEQQLAQLSNGSMLASVTSSNGAGSGAVSAPASADTATTTDFADALAQAKMSDAVGSGASSTGTLTSEIEDTAGAADTGGVGFTSASAGATLPTSASTLLTSAQQQFASTLSADTGLSPSVVSSWLLAEESGRAAQSRQAAGNNDWLNIGYTGSATYGAGDAVWSSPVSAATATADWLKGQQSIPGYGTASSGIQGILRSVGQTPAQQISALQNSGWSASGYPDLSSLYGQVVAGG